MLENATAMGARLRAGLEAIQERQPLVGDVRGMGLMQGVELVTDRATKEPAAAATTRLIEEAKRRGVLIGKGGLYGNVLRIAPCLNDVTTLEGARFRTKAIVPRGCHPGRVWGSECNCSPRYSRGTARQSGCQPGS